MKDPLGSSTSASSILAKAETAPVPQTPEGFPPPITFNSGFRSLSRIDTAEIAPDSPGIPHWIDIPSNAGPEAADAIQIFGGNGVSREYPIEKFFRDAKAAMIEDGVNEILMLTGAHKL